MGVSQQTGADRHAYWILSRRFLRQNIFEVSESLPEAKRKSALALLVRKWSPFPSTQFSAQWNGHRASVYAWDGDAVATAMSANDCNPVRASVWPETFFRAPLSGDGFRLVSMTEGLEGQVWKAGLLFATRWWPSPPTQRDWAMFLRGAGLDLSDVSLAVPDPVDLEMSDQPWTITVTPITDLWSLMQHERAAAIAAAIVAAPFLYYLAQSVVLVASTIHVERKVASLAAENQSVRADRNAAYTNLDAVVSYLSLENLPSQFQIMGVTSDLLRDSKVHVAEWNFDGNTLQLLVQADHPLEAPFFIEMFEKDDHFSNVTGTVANQQQDIRLTMELEPQQWPTS